MQQEPIDAGIYGHQVRVSLDNRLAILVTRGHDAAGAKPEEPGALKVFRLSGRAFDRRSFGRSQRRLWLWPAPSRFSSDQALGLRFARAAEPARHVRARRRGAVARAACTAKAPWPSPATSAAGRPPARFTFTRTVALSMSPTAPPRQSRKTGKPVFAGGENTLAVYEIDPKTGEPARSSTPIRAAFTAEPFTSIRAGACWSPHTSWRCRSRRAAAIREVPAGLSVFRIGGDGKLDFVRKYDVEVGERQMFWMGIGVGAVVTPPAAADGAGEGARP